jgi:predicted RND superfamily exporter protein
MSFYYVMELTVSEQRADYALKNEELRRIVEEKRCEIKFENGSLIIKFPENEDLDEEVMQTVLEVLKTPVNAKEYIYENGEKIEIFSGKLDPAHPLGQAKEEIKERTIESFEEEEEEELKPHYEELLDEIDEEEEE